MSRSSDAAVLLLNFGEPDTWEPETIVAFLEKIFAANARLEPAGDETAVAARIRELAERRAPDLARAYEAIGGSPLRRQAADQAAALGRTLADRGIDMPVEVGMQFTEPSIEDAVTRLCARGRTRLVAIPVYPLCGPSTSVAALREVSELARRLAPSPRVYEVSGWHRHPAYVRFRASGIRRTARSADLDLDDPTVRVVFSAHGTPLRYVREGSRYVEYVEQWCRLQALELGVKHWTLGYQNHANRGIEWTGPSIEEAVDSLDGVQDVVVDAISFMHEQSETLVELDVDLAAVAEARDLGFYRVPIDHEAHEFIGALADLAEAALGREVDGLPPRTACRCRRSGALCFNGEPIS